MANDSVDEVELMDSYSSDDDCTSDGCIEKDETRRDNLYDTSSYPLVLNDEILDKVLKQPARRVNDTIESVRLNQIGPSEYALNTNKGVDLDYVVGRGVGTSTYENRHEIDTHLRMLSHIDSLDKNLAGASSFLPSVTLDCTGTTEDATYAIEDIPNNLNPDRAEVLLLSNLRHCVAARVFHSRDGDVNGVDAGNPTTAESSSTGTVTDDDDVCNDARIKDVVTALNLRCCRGEDCRYKRHYFSHLGICGPVMLPNSIFTLLKFMPHAITNPTLWDAWLDALTVGLHRYIQKGKKVNDPAHTGSVDAHNMGKDENTSRDDELIFTCICCVLTKQTEFAVLRDDSLLPFKNSDGTIPPGATASKCRIGNSKFRYVLFSLRDPIKYGVSFGPTRTDNNFAQDCLGLGKRQVRDIHVNFSQYNITKDELDGLYVVKTLE